MHSKIDEQIRMAKCVHRSLDGPQKNMQVGLYIGAVAGLRPAREMTGRAVQSPHSAERLTRAFPSILTEKTDAVALRLNSLVVFRQLQGETINAHPFVSRDVTDALVKNWNIVNQSGAKNVATMEVDLAGASAKTSKDYGLRFNDAESLIAGLMSLGAIDGETIKPIVLFGPDQADADRYKADIALSALTFLIKKSDLPHPGRSMLKKDFFTPWLARKLALHLSNNVQSNGCGLNFVFSSSATRCYVPEDFPKLDLAIPIDVAAFITHNRLGEFSNGKLVLFPESIKPL